VPKPQRKHHASIREPQRYGELLVSIDSYGRRSKVEVANEYALKLLPLVWPRNSELRYGRWSEINFVTAEWRFPPSA
jgi:hypothetical protein